MRSFSRSSRCSAGRRSSRHCRPHSPAVRRTRPMICLMAAVASSSTGALQWSMRPSRGCGEARARQCLQRRTPCTLAVRALAWTGAALSYMFSRR
eukprot:1326919-Prymnesium_polylepis.1